MKKNIKIPSARAEAAPPCGTPPAACAAFSGRLSPGLRRAFPDGDRARVRRRALLRFGVLGALLTAAFASLAAGGGGERARVLAVVRPTKDFSRTERYERRPGGAATTFKAPNRSAFSHPSANMPFERQLDFRVGDGVFRKLWVSAPGSTASSDGLGPLFNARSCQRCHLKDGRGHPPAPGERAESMILRLSVPSRKGGAPDPVYGRQLQNFSTPGAPAEGEMTIAYEETPIRLADGEVVSLRRPAYGVRGLRYGPLHPRTTLSPRVAPPVIGMGLLEAIPERDLLAGADPEDNDGDGVSGRANRVWSDERGKEVIGRFGWKAGEPTLAQQAARAFHDDIGVSTPLYPNPGGDCTASQRACLSAPHGAAPGERGAEAGAKMFDLLVFYVRNLGVPARRRVDDPRVLRGKRLFYEANCVGCHRPKFVTRRDSAGEEQSFQLIWPYADLLLHDMGEGLADGQPEGAATGREWRTPPLWGVGLAETVSGRAFFLHDGRARSLLEAILWHGGEAERSKRRVMRMTKAEREALLAFLRSL